MLCGMENNAAVPAPSVVPGVVPFSPPPTRVVTTPDVVTARTRCEFWSATKITTVLPAEATCSEADAPSDSLPPTLSEAARRVAVAAAAAGAATEGLRGGGGTGPGAAAEWAPAPRGAASASLRPDAPRAAAARSRAAEPLMLSSASLPSPLPASLPVPPTPAP